LESTALTPKISHNKCAPAKAAPYLPSHRMKTRGGGTPGRAAVARVSRVLQNVPDAAQESTKPATKKQTHPTHETEKQTIAFPPRARRRDHHELVRAAWHAFPGFLAVGLFLALFQEQPWRTWRAASVALTLMPLTAAVWGVEWVRLRGGGARHAGSQSNGDAARVAWLLDAVEGRGEPRAAHPPDTAGCDSIPCEPLLVATAGCNSTRDTTISRELKVFCRLSGARVPLTDAVLRPDELRKVHGTAWYLLGVCISLGSYPADVAVLSICYLAWWGATPRLGQKSATACDLTPPSTITLCLAFEHAPRYISVAAPRQRVRVTRTQPATR
jgi:hypothetical protein